MPTKRMKIKKHEINKKIKDIKKSAILFLEKKNEKIRAVKIVIPKIVINPLSFPLSIYDEINIQIQISESELNKNIMFCF